MNSKAALVRLAVLLILPVAFGCQTTRGVQESTAVAAKEPALQGNTVAAKEAGVLEASPAGKVQAPAAQKEQEGVTLKDQNDKFSYIIGLDIGKDLLTQELGLNVEPLMQGIRDSLQGSKPLLTPVEFEAVRLAFVKERQAARAKALGPHADKNLREGEAFLQENARKEGVKTLPSGLQYKVLKPGKADSNSPSIDDNVMVHFLVKSIAGKELDSTYKNEKPAVLPVKGVIPAWTEALQLMKEGEKWEIYAPAYLAYGDQGIGEAVGPFQALVFEMELVGIH